jgi:hypothetical protein
VPSNHDHRTATALSDGAGSADRSEIAGLWAATLSVAEVGVGSFMHALHVPLTGTILSLNQAAFLTRFVKLNRHRHDVRSLTLDVSTVTALIKSFAPIGKRLTPMLAISVQGLLFTVGLWAFGVNLMGALVGSCLLAAWGILQPAILAGIMYKALSMAEQERVISAWQKMLAELPALSSFAMAHDLLQALTLLFAAKCFCAVIFTTFAWRSSTREHSMWGRWERWMNRSSKLRPQHSPLAHDTKGQTIGTALRLALRDLKDPMIWVSLGILSGLSWFLDSDYRASLWIGMRALAGIYLFYVALRLIPWDHILGSNARFAAPLRHALKTLATADRRRKIMSDGNDK